MCITDDIFFSAKEFVNTETHEPFLKRICLSWHEIHETITFSKDGLADENICCGQQGAQT